MAINQLKDLVRAIPYIAKQKGLKNDEYFNELTQNLPEEAKAYLQSVYYLEILQQSPPFRNESDSNETDKF